MEHRRRWLALGAALTVVGVCVSLDAIVTSTPAAASNQQPSRHHPSPTPTPAPTPAPTPMPRPTPPPTPNPTPPPTSLPTPAATQQPTPPASDAPSAAPTAAPTVVAVAADAPVGSSTAQPGSNLPYTGPTTQDGSAQAVAIAPSARAQAAAPDVIGPSDSQNLFWLIMLAVMAIPAFVVMTLVATVLIRR